MRKFARLDTVIGALRYGAWLDSSRLMRIAVCLTVVGAVLLAVDFWYQAHQGQPPGRDFINYWTGAQLAVHGKAAQVYDLRAFIGFERAHVSPAAFWRWYSYPPVALLLSLPLGLVGFGLGLALWLFAGFALCARLLAPSIGWRWAAFASFAAPASLWNALSGQNGAFSASLFAGGILLLGRRPWLAGALLGALCFKPHLVMLIPLALLAGRQYRALAATMLSVLVLCAASFLLFGPQTWAGFLHNAPFNAVVLEQGNGYWPRMPTLFAATRYIGGSIPLAFTLHGLGALAAVAIMLLVWRSQAALPVKGAGLILATFLATPYAWDYDLVAIVFAVAWLAREGMQSGFQPFEKCILALAVIEPFLVMPFLAFLHVQLGFVFLWPALIITWHRACQFQRQPARWSLATTGA